MSASTPPAVGRLSSKIAVVTGAGGGLGRAISLRFAAAGAILICHDIDAAAVEETRRAADRVAPGSAFAHVGDVTDSADVDAMFDAVQAEHGTVDVLVSNAGVTRTPGDGSEAGRVASDVIGEMERMEDEGWKQMLDVHLNGAFYFSRAMIRRLRAADKPGSLIFVSSVAALGGWGPVHYAAGKGGLLGLVRAIAMHGGGSGLRANAICPGTITTSLSAGTDEGAHRRVTEQTPLGRFGIPDDVAHAAVYLAGDESAYITGQVLSPSGGLEMAR